MAKHITHKATREGRMATIERKQRRRQKYQPEHQALADLERDLHAPRLMSWRDRVITVQEGQR